jgi:hypothetical protein
MKTIGVGIIGASPGAGRAGHQPSRKRQHPGHRVGSGRRSRIGPQRDAVHLHRLIDRIAGGASIADVTLQPDFKENSCAPQF